MPPGNRGRERPRCRHSYVSSLALTCRFNKIGSSTGPRLKGRNSLQTRPSRTPLEMARNGPQKPSIELNLVAATLGPSATGRRYSDGAVRFPQSLFLSLLKSEFCTSVYSRWNHQFYVTLLAVLRQFPRGIYRPVVHVCITSSRSRSSVENPANQHLTAARSRAGKSRGSRFMRHLARAQLRHTTNTARTQSAVKIAPSRNMQSSL